MKFPSPLKEGTFLKRYKRFFADFRFENTVYTGLVANTGSMKGCNEPGRPCLFLHHQDKERKFPYSVEMIRTTESWVGVNTARPNQLIWEAWENKVFNHWKKFDRAQKEVKINEHSRIDFVLWKSKDLEIDRLKKYDFKNSKAKMHLVEVKNVSLGENGCALFPDSVTERGQKHLKDLIQAVEYGHSAEIIFVIQRQDCTSFSPADAIDAEYGKLLRQASKRGVRVSPYACKLSSVDIEIIPKLLPCKL
jgi:sugar fermentation stimulation protein A